MRVGMQVLGLRWEAMAWAMGKVAGVGNGKMIMEGD